MSGFLLSGGTVIVVVHPSRTLSPLDCARVPTLGKILQASDGDLWSTAGAGGPFGYGQVFAVTTSGAAVANVGFNGTDGSFPVGGVIQTMRRYAVWRDREARKDCQRRVGVR